MNINEINAIISLLDDPDTEVQEQIRKRIVEEGRTMLPFLEEFIQQNHNCETTTQIARDTYRDIQVSELRTELEAWRAEGAEDLIQGALIICKYEYPDIDEQEVHDFISRVRQDVWLELNESLTAFEVIKVFNIVFFDEYGFAGNKEDYHQIENSFINKVIQNRRGNPLLLSILYMSIAQQLEIPIQGVNLPNHFLVAYIDEFGIAEKMGSGSDNILFYINPFSRGAILHRSEVDTFIKHLDLKPEPRFYKPCTHDDMIRRMINNLIHAYQKCGEGDKASELGEFVATVKSKQE